MARSDAKIRIRGENDTKRAFGQVNRSLQKLGGAAKRFGKVMGLGLGAAGAGLIALTKQTLTQADALGKLSQQTGLTVTELQKYEFAASQTGTTQELFNTGMQAFGKRLGELRSGTGSLLGFLKKADPEFAKMLENTDSTGEAMRLLADKMASIEDPADRAALGAAAFSRSAGVALANTLSEGSRGLQTYGEELEKTGSIMTEEGVAASEKFNDALDKLTRSTLGAFRKTITDMAPQLQAWAEQLAERAPAAIEELIKWLKDAGPQIKSFVSGLGSVIEVVSTVVGWFIQFGTFLGETVAKIVIFVDDSVQKFRDMKESVVQFVEDMITGIKDAIVAPLRDIGNKVKGWTEGVTGWFGDMYEEVVGGSFVPDMMQGIKIEFDKLPDIMVDPSGTATGKVTDSFRTMRNSISTLLSDIINGTKSFGSSMKSILGGIADNIIQRGIDKVSGAITEGIAAKVSGSGSFTGAAGKALLGGASKLFGGASTISGAGGSAAAGGISGASVTGGSAGAGLGGAGASAGAAPGMASLGAAGLAIPIVAGMLIKEFKLGGFGDKPEYAKVLEDIERHGFSGMGPLGGRVGQGERGTFFGGPNAGFAGAFARSQGVGTATGGGRIDQSLAEMGIAGFKGIDLDGTIKLLEQAEAEFERLKATARDTFQLSQKESVKVGQALQDGVIDQTELANLGFTALGEKITNTKSGVVKMGDVSVEQFDKIMQAVNNGIFRLEALRGETRLNQQEMQFLGSAGLTAAEGLRALGREGAAALGQIEGAANRAAGAISNVGGARRDPNVGPSEDDVIREINTVQQLRDNATRR